MIMINTQEYTHQLTQLQHGMITPEEWMAYCASIKRSIIVEPAYAKDNEDDNTTSDQEDVPEHRNRALV